MPSLAATAGLPPVAGSPATASIPAGAARTLRDWTRRLRERVESPERRLAPERMLAAYRDGRFPLLDERGRLVWCTPDPRALIPLDDRFRIGKRLGKRLQDGRFQVTFDRAFSEVVQACGEGRPAHERVWLTPLTVAAYTRLHALGHAHSVEVWQDGRLVGGEFGVALGGLYSGESMFTRADYAGRVAVVHLVRRLQERGFALLDSQFMSPTIAEFGAFEVSNATYQGLLADALRRPVTFG